MGIALLDTIIGKSIPLYSRDAISHFVLLVITFSVIYLLPGGPVKWGLNLRNWRSSLTLGIVFGLTLGILFSLFSVGAAISRWNFTTLMTQLRNSENLVHLLSQLFLIGTSEELFFRGILVTYLMKKYSEKFLGIHLGVIIVSLVFGSLQFYKLFFGANFVTLLPLVFGGFLYGLVLGWIYQKTQTLMGSITAHNLCNSFMFVISIGVQ